jgi:hypothetical protein
VSPLTAALLLGLQVPDRIKDADEPPNAASVELAAIRTFWFPEFRGRARVDGASTSGTTLRLIDDLRLPNDKVIPIFTGGDISVTVRQTLSTKDRLLFSAEYWTREWMGNATLASTEVLGNAVFPAGTYVEDRLHLLSVTLDAYLVHEEEPFRVGFTFPIHILSARLRMDAASAADRDSFLDVCWGGGVFADVRPIRYAFAGVSAKAYTGMTHFGRTGGSDVRGYVGAEWWHLRLEGGYRYRSYEMDLQERDFRYTLGGPYVAFSLILRF